MSLAWLTCFLFLSFNHSRSLPPLVSFRSQLHGKCTSGNLNLPYPALSHSWFITASYVSFRSQLHEKCTKVIWTHPPLSHVWFLTASYVAFKQISLPPSLSICLSLSLAWSLNPRYQLHGKCTSGKLNLPCSVSLLFSYRIICLF
jgi:hypothetical protein